MQVFSFSRFLKLQTQGALHIVMFKVVFAMLLKCDRNSEVIEIDASIRWSLTINKLSSKRDLKMVLLKDRHEGYVK